MSPLIASTLDEIYDSFLQSLPESERAPARALAQVPREGVLPGLPLLLAEGLPGAYLSTVRDAARAHLLGLIAAEASRRLQEGTVTASPELTSVLEALRRARDEALGRMGASLPPGPRTDAALAEQDASAARAEARALLGRRAPVSLEAYERLMLRTHAPAFPATLAMASVSGCNEARKRVLHQAVTGLAMGLQARGDALNWEEDEARGASWAVCLMRQRVGGSLPAHPAELRRLVQGCGVVVRLLERTREHFAEVKRAAGWIGSRELERWAEAEARSANMLARTEARSPGHAVQWKAQHLAAV